MYMYVNKNNYFQGIGSVACDGHETEFKNCHMEYDVTCTSGTYASVYCSHETIVDSGM